MQYTDYPHDLQAAHLAHKIGIRCGRRKQTGSVSSDPWKHEFVTWIGTKKTLVTRQRWETAPPPTCCLGNRNRKCSAIENALCNRKWNAYRSAANDSSIVFGNSRVATGVTVCSRADTLLHTCVLLINAQAFISILCTVSFAHCGKKLQIFVVENEWDRVISSATVLAWSMHRAVRYADYPKQLKIAVCSINEAFIGVCDDSRNGGFLRVLEVWHVKYAEHVLLQDCVDAVPLG